MIDKAQLIQDQINDIQWALTKLLESPQGSDVTPLKKRFDQLLTSFIVYRKLIVKENNG